SSSLLFRSNLNSKLELPSGQHQLWLTPKVLFPTGTKINKERDEYIGEERICSQSAIRLGFTTTCSTIAQRRIATGQDSGHREAPKDPAKVPGTDPSRLETKRVRRLEAGCGWWLSSGPLAGFHYNR